MQEYNYSKLLGRIKECGFTQVSLAKRLGIDASTLNLTINNKRNFRQNEILRIAEILCIQPIEITSYFFVQKL
jgi:Helix-turn-helix.